MAEKKWMQKAFSKNKGKLHRELGVPQGQKIPAAKIEKATHAKSGTLRKEANLAKTAAKIRRGK